MLFAHPSLLRVSPTRFVSLSSSNRCVDVGCGDSQARNQQTLQTPLLRFPTPNPIT
ncbi:hypothetical protein XAB3213_1270001 [Xanthomonas citri pv. bilvae]|nr:hypothetical protein XAB3213_1270001 [Xanthomonas citri pv. bilvae]